MEPITLSIPVFIQGMCAGSLGLAGILLIVVWFQRKKER